MNNPEYYSDLRSKYTPDKIRVIFLLESPPIDETYFYNPNDETPKPLYSAMMKYLNYKPLNKADGLREFKDRGYLIIDSTYKPVNNLPRGAKRNISIALQASTMIADILNNQADEPKVIIIMPHLHRMYYNLLNEIGLKVINHEPIPFPLYQWKAVFLSKLNILKSRYNLL